jgi:hypothetical protein
MVSAAAHNRLKHDRFEDGRIAKSKKSRLRDHCVLVASLARRTTNSGHDSVSRHELTARKAVSYRQSANANSHVGGG